MERKRKTKLIAKVLIVGAVIAILSYILHPDVGQLSILDNGKYIAEPLVRLAVILTILLFLGINQSNVQ